MKTICTVSHKITHEGGGYTTYTAGQEYDLDTPDPEYFRPPDATVTIHAVDADSFEQHVKDNPQDVASPKRRK